MSSDQFRRCAIINPASRSAVFISPSIVTARLSGCPRHDINVRITYDSSELNPRIGVQQAVMRRRLEKYPNIRETPDEQVGRMKALDTLHDRNKPIDLNETGYDPLGSW